MAIQDLVWVPVVFGILEAREGVRASAPLGVTLPGLAKRKAFRNSRGHGLATVVPWSVSVFLLGKTSVGRTKRGSTRCTTRATGTRHHACARRRDREAAGNPLRTAGPARRAATPDRPAASAAAVDAGRRKAQPPREYRSVDVWH